ncbi:hypothetical protein NDU88_003934 [Pleurodeles waltl]|uniref:Uncharacterized protein n=1 Tax=Pleurodeles waltl TaxID=8319 RepID=A0AAV7LJV9_PLEWA|nr:hypothetical protein NDU88_003934 [Pleurodeles waltl]
MSSESRTATCLGEEVKAAARGQTEEKSNAASANGAAILILCRAQVRIQVCIPRLCLHAQRGVWGLPRGHGCMEALIRRKRAGFNSWKWRGIANGEELKPSTSLSHGC